MKLVIGLLVALVGCVYAFYCPCERTPGVYLLGNEVAEPVTDWAFANGERLCQIQVSGPVLPHAINLNCMSAGGELFLSCSYCDGKTWSSAALTDPNARLRVGANVYPVHLTRLKEANRLDLAWHARSSKLGIPAEQQRPDHWWSFAVRWRDT